MRRCVCLVVLGCFQYTQGTLVVALDLGQSKTVSQGLVPGGSFYNKQGELEHRLKSMGITGIRKVKVPHITLFSGIKDTPANRVILTKALHAVALSLAHQRIYIALTDLSTRGLWGQPYFYVAFNTAIKQYKFGNTFSLSKQALLDSIEHALRAQGLSASSYHKAAADHASLVEVHSSSGGHTSDGKRKKVQKQVATGSLRYPQFSMPLPVCQMIWINNITLYRVTRSQPVNVAQTFKKLHSVKL